MFLSNPIFCQLMLEAIRNTFEAGKMSQRNNSDGRECIKRFYMLAMYVCVCESQSFGSTVTFAQTFPYITFHLLLNIYAPFQPSRRLLQLDGPEPTRIAPYSHNPLMDFNHVFYANSADQHKHVCFFFHYFSPRPFCLAMSKILPRNFIILLRKKSKFVNNGKTLVWIAGSSETRKWQLIRKTSTVSCVL